VTSENIQSRDSRPDNYIATTSSNDFAEQAAGTVLLNNVSWSAVFAGVAIALISQLLLNMLGVGIGIGTLDVNASDNPTASGLSLGAGIWWAISGIIAAGLGGYAAGRLSGVPEPTTSAWHGLTSWAVTTLLTVYLLTTAIGSVLGGAASAIGNASGLVGRSPTVQGLTKSVDPSTSLDAEVRAAAGDQGAQRELAIAAIRDLMIAEGPRRNEARDRAANALASAQGIPKDQALQRVTNLETQVQQRTEQAKQAAKSGADAATRILPWTMITAVVALLLGAWTAWWAGKEAAVSPTWQALTHRFRTRSTSSADVR
jgi:hypothetical protein